MTTFTPSQVVVLRQLASLWAERRYALVGAAALGCFMPMTWRKTNDLDIIVSADIGRVPSDLGMLTGWKPHPKKEHEWHAPGAVKIDIIPASDDLLDIGSVQWPKTGNVMSLVGMRLALKNAIPHPVAASFSVAVAPPPVIVLLKMVAYLDRPYDRTSDLADISYAFDEFAHGDGLFSDEVIASGVDFSCASAFLLGRSMAPLLGKPELRVVLSFVDKATDEHDPEATEARFLRHSPWTTERELNRRMDAFRLGLDHSHTSSG